MALSRIREAGLPMNPSIRGRFGNALLMLMAVVVTGTLGYYLFFDFSAVDALYMTVITLSTVGYGEVGSLDTGGRLFTVALIVCSLGVVGYSFSSLAAFLMEGELNRIIRGRRMDKRIAGLSGHVILCGGGHTGSAIAEEFVKTEKRFVIVEKDEGTVADLHELGDVLYVQGDATDDDTLRLAGIERAAGLISSMGEDRDNVFVVLSARALNPKLRIVARVIENENAPKLRKAGADEIVSSDAIGGMRMASLMVRPSVVSFLDHMLRMKGALRMEEVALDSSSSLADKTLAQAELGRRTGLLVVAIKHVEGEYDFNPGGDTRLDAGDVLIVMGSREQLRSLEKLEQFGTRRIVRDN